jgi:major facilitator 4 family protein
MARWRHAFLAGVAVSTFASQAVWVTFAPVSTLVASELGVEPEAVGLLALLYPAFFLALTLPSGVLLDRSLTLWVSAGALLTGLAGTLRLLDPRSYEWLLACQLLGALGQPFLLNSFALIASRLYPERRETVVSLLSFSMYLGIIYALGTGYAVYTRLGIEGLVAPVAAVSAAGAALTLASAARVGAAGGGGGAGVLAGLRYAARQRDLWLLGLLLGLGVALFDNMSIWLETALAPAGLGDVAGVSVALALLAGLAGVTFIPGLVARAGARTLYIRAVVAAVTAIYLTLALHTSRPAVLTLIPLAGLLMLPAYPIIMEWVSRFHDPRAQGSAAGFIGLVSRVLTVTLASAAALFTGSPETYFLYLAALSAAGLAISLLLPSGR